MTDGEDKNPMFYERFFTTAAKDQDINMGGLLCMKKTKMWNGRYLHRYRLRAAELTTFEFYAESYTNDGTIVLL
jgi:hypothetical protein